MTLENFSLNLGKKPHDILQQSYGSMMLLYLQFNYNDLQVKGQVKLLRNAFIYSQFNCGAIIWMFCRKKQNFTVSRIFLGHTVNLKDGKKGVI